MKAELTDLEANALSSLDADARLEIQKYKDKLMLGSVHFYFDIFVRMPYKVNLCFLLVCFSLSLKYFNGGVIIFVMVSVRNSAVAHTEA